MKGGVMSAASVSWSLFVIAVLLQFQFFTSAAAAGGDTGTNATDQLTSLPQFPAFKSANYAGYVSIPGGRRSFYYFIESERSPSKDPVILWLNGGPGCSSLLGLFTEIGPFTMRHSGEFFNNSYGWTTVANVLFVESPAGVGFSKDANPPTAWNDTITAQLNYAFLLGWFEKFPAFKGHDFYITGESYAGHYIPQLASQIQYGSAAWLKTMMKGFMAGNPCTGTAIPGSDLDWCFTEDPTLTEWYQGHAFLSFDNSLNRPMGPYCEDGDCPLDPWYWVDFDPYDTLERYCPIAGDLAVARWLTRNKQQQGTQQHPFLARRMGIQEEHKPKRLHSGALPTYGACTSYYLTEWLNKPEVQQALHADVGTVWGECSYTLDYKTPNTTKGVKHLYEDFMANTAWNILIYSGTADAVVNFVQTEKIVISFNRPALTNYMPWYYQDMFNFSWKQLGGFYVNYDRISWASVNRAGHMVPTYVPAAAFQLLNSFLATGRPGADPPLGNGTAPWPWQANTGTNFPVASEFGMFLGGLFVGIFFTALIAYSQTRKPKKAAGLEGLSEEFSAREAYD